MSPHISPAGLLHTHSACRNNSIKTKIQADTREAAKALEKSLPEPAVKRNGAPRQIPLSLQRSSMRAVARRILEERGIAGFFRGFSASMLNTFAMQLCVHLLSAFRDLLHLHCFWTAPSFTGQVWSEMCTLRKYTQLRREFRPPNHSALGECISSSGNTESDHVSAQHRAYTERTCWSNSQSVSEPSLCRSH